MCTGARTATAGSTPARRRSRVRLPRRPRGTRGPGWTAPSRRVPSVLRVKRRSRARISTAAPPARVSGRTRGGAGVDAWRGVRGACRRRSARYRARAAGHTNTSVPSAHRAGRTTLPVRSRSGSGTPIARHGAPRPRVNGVPAGSRRPEGCPSGALLLGAAAGVIAGSCVWRRRPSSSSRSVWCSLRPCTGSRGARPEAPSLPGRGPGCRGRRWPWRRRSAIRPNPKPQTRAPRRPSVRPRCRMLVRTTRRRATRRAAGSRSVCAAPSRRLIGRRARACRSRIRCRAGQPVEPRRGRRERYPRPPLLRPLRRSHRSRRRDHR